MNADSAFHIGATHAVCQDYALACNSLPPALHAESGYQFRPYTILSDGCSSSPDTDIGARLLVKAAQQMLRPDGGTVCVPPAQLHAEAARRALEWAELLGLRPPAVDATLLTAHLDGDELILACTGDGVLCLQTQAGAIDVYSISSPSGYPLYPGYTHQPERLHALADGGLSRKEVRRFRCASLEEPLRLSDISDGDSMTETFSFRAADYKFAALFSDGIHSFHSDAQTATGKRAEAIPFETVLRELISFKTLRGAFVGRRLKRFLKDCQAKNWRHTDDLAFATLHLGD